MEAIVLAGGFGTRLRSVVKDVPKPMANVCGKPFLELVLNSLAQKGFHRVVLSVGYMADVIQAHFGSQFSGMEITYAIEDTPLGTGGAIRNAMQFCDEQAVAVFNGDTYLDLDSTALKIALNECIEPAIVIKSVDDTHRYGRVEIHENRISRFAEKGISGKGYINAGTYLLPKSCLDGFPLMMPFSVEQDFFIPLIQHQGINALVTSGLFIDIGIPEDYFRAQDLLKFLSEK